MAIALCCMYKARIQRNRIRNHAINQRATFYSFIHATGTNGSYRMNPKRWIATFDVFDEGRAALAMRRSLPAGRTRFTRALPCRSARKRRSLPECLPDGRTGFTRALPCRSAREAPEPPGACLTVEPASPAPWPCRSARHAPGASRSLPDGRTRFTRALAVPERPRSAGASRSRACLPVEPASPVPWPCRSARHAPGASWSLPAGRTGFTRALPCRSARKRRSLPECLPDGRTGFTRALPCRSAREAPEPPGACLTVEPASPAPWPCRSARKRRSLPSLPDGRTRFTRALAVPERPQSAS